MRALVTGGRGFLGAAIVRRLLSAGHEVRTFSRGALELDAAGLQARQGDLADEDAVTRAAEGCHVVFHAAAKVGLWGRYEDYRRVNVDGTRNVLRACERAGVGTLVFTGSPSVVFDGSDCEGWDESTPYAGRYDSHYSRSKAEAEEQVLLANGSRLSTVSLRPHLIWGPGDPHICARIIAQGRAGRLRRIGAADKLVDVTYIDDAADAHLLAAKCLQVRGSPAAGRAYFLSSGDPRPLWEIVNAILDAAGLPSVERSVPAWAAKAGAVLCEAGWCALGLDGEPPLTRFLVSQLSTAHWFDISAARRDLGYEPRVPMEEGLRRLKAWLCRNPAAAVGL